MSRTYVHAHADIIETRLQRGQRKGHPPVRRTGTRAAIIAAALAEYGVDQ